MLGEIPEGVLPMRDHAPVVARWAFPDDPVVFKHEVDDQDALTWLAPRPPATRDESHGRVEIMSKGSDDMGQKICEMSCRSARRSDAAALIQQVCEIGDDAAHGADYRRLRRVEPATVAANSKAAVRRPD